MADTKFNYTREQERKIREAALDETIEESFPASDPPSSIPNPLNRDAFDRSAAAVRTGLKAS